MISLERPKAEMQSEDTPNMVCQEKIAGVLRAVCGKPAEFSVCCGETEVCIKGADVQRAEKVPMSRVVWRSR